MCEFVSWGVMKKTKKDLNLKKGQIIWLTDDMVIAKFGEDANFSDYVGHRGLAKYYTLNESDFVHEQSSRIIPRKIARDVNAGRMKRLAAAFSEEARTWKFTDPAPSPYMRLRPYDLRSLMFEDIVCNAITMNVRAKIVPVFEAIRRNPDFPHDLSETADLIQSKLLDPKYDINPWNNIDFPLRRFVGKMFNWDKLGNRAHLDVIHDYVLSYWGSAVKEVYGIEPP